jgi:hypothetical protein
VSLLRRLGPPVAVLTGLLALVVVFQPTSVGLAFRVWLVAIGALASAALFRAALSGYRPAPVEPLRLRPRRPLDAVRPPGLEEVERAVDFAGWNAADLRSRLRPILREVAVQRLQAGPGVDLQRDPTAARRLLGEEGWALVSEEVASPDAR